MSAVYFIRVGEFVKIGFASNPEKRLIEIARSPREVALPDGYDLTATPELVMTVPDCRMRDERNMQILFATHWVAGEWFRWSPAFRFQMRTMQFVTHAERRRHLSRVRKIHGGRACVKEERWGMQTAELLAHLAEWRATTSAPTALPRAS